MARPHITENRIPCEIEDCEKNFARMADMRRHVVEVHGSPKRCPEPNCNWGGAKRGERLEDHKMKAHPEIYNEVVLNVPEGFGTPSPRILGQAPQPEGSMGGAAMNDYFSFAEGPVPMGQHANDTLPEPNSRIPVALNSPVALDENNERGAAQWDLPLAQDRPTFQETLPRYPSHSAIPGVVFPSNPHPPLIFPEPGDQDEDVIEGRQGAMDGNARNKGRQYPWP